MIKFNKYKISESKKALSTLLLPDSIENLNISEDPAYCYEYLCIYYHLLETLLTHPSIKSKAHIHTHCQEASEITTPEYTTVQGTDDTYSDYPYNVGTAAKSLITIKYEDDFTRVECVSFTSKDAKGNDIIMYGVHTYDPMCGGVPSQYFYLK